MPKQSYKQAKIPAITATGVTLYYYDLSSIAIDYLKSFASENVLNRGWDKVPKNKSDAKVRIINSLIAMRREGDDGKYVLDQESYLETIERMWGESRACTTPHHNDRVRVYGLVMTRPNNREMY